MYRTRGQIQSAVIMSVPIGSEGSLSMQGLEIRVTVMDARQRFGSIDYLVSPVAGSGMVWVTSDRVHISI